MKKKFLESQRAEKQARVDTEQAKKQVPCVLMNVFNPSPTLTVKNSSTWVSV